ncbi:MAG: glycosyl hydrolase family 65 protein [Terracidiphilus sp.]
MKICGSSVLRLLLPICLFAWCMPASAEAKPVAQLLSPESYRHYFTEFGEQQHAFLGDQPVVNWTWFAANIPWLDVPDKDLEQIYYFRWYSFQKHIRSTPDGHIIDEFLDNVPWAGKFNAIDCAAEDHLKEARWLRDPAYADEDARFWFSPDGEPRRYSFAAADSVYAVYLANGDTQRATGLLPALVNNYQAWEKTHQDPNGLFWQIDDRDGMEDSIGGSGYRPTINSYMYGDAVAIAKIAALNGDDPLRRQYAKKAAGLRGLVESRLWNPKDEFYETAPRNPGAARVGVRELIGYVPWYFDLPHADRAVAWRQLADADGFAGKYGPTTAERRSPRFRFQYPHECLWNGPSWPFATTQTLVALANLLNGPPQTVIGPDEYREVLAEYVRSQHIELPNGEQIPWIDEDLDPDTGQWIARTILQAKKQPPPNRGRYYNHSGFADLIITGLLGLRPSTGDTLTIQPLVSDQWQWFALDGVPYHGHLLTVFYDKTGNRYHRGTGLSVLCDGVEIGWEPTPAPFAVHLPAQKDTSSSPASR